MNTKSYVKTTLAPPTEKLAPPTEGAMKLRRIFLVPINTD